MEYFPIKEIVELFTTITVVAILALTVIKITAQERL